MARLPKVSTTVQEAAENWLDAKAAYGRSEKTVEQYRHSIGWFLRYLEETYPGEQVTLDDIDRAMLMKYAGWLSKSTVITTVGTKAKDGKRLSPESVASYMRALKNLLNWCDEYGLLNGPNPAAGKGIVPRVPRNPKRAPDRNDAAKLLEAVERFDPTFGSQRRLGSAMQVRARAILLTFFDTGMRVSELVNLDLGDWDKQAGALHIRSSKQGHSRFAFVSGETAAAINLWLLRSRKQLTRRAGPVRSAYFDSLLEHVSDEDPDKDGPLFVDRRGGRMTIQAVRLWLADLCDRAGTRRYSPHDLRRLYITQAAASGAPLTQIQAQVGHANIVTTQKYVVSDTALQREAAIKASLVSRLSKK